MKGFKRMKLDLVVWQKEDFDQFDDYLISLKNEDKVNWTKSIYATNKKCLAIKLPILRDIAKKIGRGNIDSFLNGLQAEYIEQDILRSILISQIDDFERQKKLIVSFLKIVDSWVCTDTLKLNYKKVSFEQIKILCKDLISGEIFLRRFAFVLLLKYAKNEACIDFIFNLIEKMHHETEYFVNMAMAWLLCEITIYFPERALNFIINYKNNYKKENNHFLTKKYIGKCKDSFRINNDFKEKLKILNY